LHPGRRAIGDPEAGGDIPGTRRIGAHVGRRPVGDRPGPLAFVHDHDPSNGFGFLSHATTSRIFSHAPPVTHCQLRVVSHASSKRAAIITNAIWLPSLGFPHACQLPIWTT